MNGKIDRYGRIAIPKAVRDRLGLHPGNAVEIVEHESLILITSVSELAPLRRAEDGCLVLCSDLDFVADDPRETVRELRHRQIMATATEVELSY